MVCNLLDLLSARQRLAGVLQLREEAPLQILKLRQEVALHLLDIGAEMCGDLFGEVLLEPLHVLLQQLASPHAVLVLGIPHRLRTVGHPPYSDSLLDASLPQGLELGQEVVLQPVHLFLHDGVDGALAAVLLFLQCLPRASAESHVWHSLSCKF